MAYTKTEWKDQNVENPHTYLVRDNGDSTVTLMDAFGTVTELGTPVNAENMNKIENGIANAVDLDSAQDITGKKTFTNNVNPVVLKKSGDNTYTEIQLQDKNGIRQGGIRSIADSSQEQLTLYVASADGNSIIGSIGIAKDSHNGIKTLCPAPAASTDTSNVAIMTVGRAADPTQNFNLLHRSGDEIFSGVKTIKNNNPKFGFKNTLADISKPSARTNSSLFFLDKNGLFTGEIRNEFSSTGYLETAIYTNSKTSGTLQTSYIKVIVNKNGEVYATCPTPPDAADSSTKIATTAWVNSRITSIMNSVGQGYTSQKGNTYIKFSNGLIMQWGKSTSSSRTITFEIPFTRSVAVNITPNSESGYNFAGAAYNVSITGFTIHTYGGVSPSPYFWTAIGY